MTKVYKFVDQPSQVTTTRELWLAQGGRLPILFRLVWPKRFSLGARPRVHMHRHILVYVRNALMSIIISFWIVLTIVPLRVPSYRRKKYRVPGPEVLILVVFNWSRTQLQPC